MSEANVRRRGVGWNEKNTHNALGTKDNVFYIYGFLYHHLSLVNAFTERMSWKQRNTKVWGNDHFSPLWRTKREGSRDKAGEIRVSSSS